MILSVSDELHKSATLKDILDGTTSVPESLRLKPRQRKMLGDFLDTFNLREQYERQLFTSLSMFTEDPTYIGFSRAYQGQPVVQRSFEPNRVGIMVGYLAGMRLNHDHTDG